MDDLNAEFLKLQQEVADVEKSLPPPPPPNSPPPPPLPPPPPPDDAVISSLPLAPLPTEAQVVVKAQASARPAWQQEMFDRDRQEIAATAAVRREADAITGAASNATRSKKNGGPNGEWISTGNQWEWKTYTDSSVTPKVSSSASDAQKSTSVPKKRIVKRMAAGEVWTDNTLNEWPENDFRIFVGDLAPDATEAELSDAFGRYKSFNMARVVRDKRSGKCRGYGFVSFATGEDMVSALREMNGKYVGSRPVKLKKSSWQKRTLTKERRKQLKLFRSIGK